MRINLSPTRRMFDHSQQIFRSNRLPRYGDMLKSFFRATVSLSRHEITRSHHDPDLSHRNSPPSWQYCSKPFPLPQFCCKAFPLPHTGPSSWMRCWQFCCKPFLLPHAGPSSWMRWAFPLLVSRRPAPPHRPDRSACPPAPEESMLKVRILEDCQALPC